jgi:ankyrin repeat protein
VKRTLQTLPKTLDETYERILLGIPSQYQQEAISALTWLVFGKRPLTIEELAEASVIDLTSTTNRPFDANERLLDPGSILATLSGLVSVIEATSVYEKAKIRLAHFSVEEYLVSERIKNSPASAFHLSYTSSARSLSRGCLHYLQCPNISEAVLFLGYAAAFPFLAYAAKYWPAHVKDCEGSTPSWLLDVLWSFFGSQNSFRFWEKVQLDSLEYDFKFKEIENLNWLRRTGSRTSAPDTYMGPFYHACRYGLADIVQRFLDIDANSGSAAMSGPEKVAGLYANELHAACYFGQEVVFFKLLDAGADYAHVGLASTALDATMQSRSPNKQIIHRLLELSDRLPTSDSTTGLIMQLAVHRADLRTVDLLLEKADGLDRGFNWTKPSNNNTVMLIQSLSSYQSQCSAPYEAALLGHFDILQRLINCWGYVNEADSEGRTALYWAAFHGHEKVVKLLLDNGAWANVVIHSYCWKPIDWAQRRGDLATVELLRERSLDGPEHHVWMDQSTTSG